MKSRRTRRRRCSAEARPRGCIKPGYQDPPGRQRPVDVDALELASLFTLQVDVKGGVDPKRSEPAIDQAT